MNPLHFSRFRLLSELETEGVSRLADDCSGDGSDQVDSLLKFSGLMNRQQISLKDKGGIFIQYIIQSSNDTSYSPGNNS